MNYNKIKALIKKKLNLKKIYLNYHNDNIDIIAIGDFFLGMNSFEKQKTIYKILSPYFLKKKIHAITIKAYSTSEWKKKNL